MKDRREQELMRVKGFEMNREGDYIGSIPGMCVLSWFGKPYSWRALCQEGAVYPEGAVLERRFANPIAAATWLQQVWLQRRIEQELAVAAAKRRMANDHLSNKGRP
jgi:hypothetical protein